MTRHIFPFNYVVPGESHNNLVGRDDLARHSRHDELAEAAPLRQETAKNEHSGSSYRMINAIVDYPVRLPDHVPNPVAEALGRVVFVHVEFQVVDEDTARRNETGENAHRHYKGRQTAVVELRLRRGAATRRRAAAHAPADDDASG